MFSLQISLMDPLSMLSESIKVLAVFQNPRVFVFSDVHAKSCFHYLGFATIQFAMMFATCGVNDLQM